ncbi:hypothetical protein Tco_0605857 [Tanacetum coccineum]
MLLGPKFVTRSHQSWLFIPSIIGCSISTVGLDFDHTDCQRGNPAIFDIKRICVFTHINDVTLVDETQERQDDELMFDTKVFDADEMHVEEKVDEKDEQSTKLNDSTAGKAIKVAKPKVVTTAATTTTTTRPKAKGVVVQEPSEFRVPQEAQPSISKDKGKGIMFEPEVPLKRKDQIALDEQIARDIQAKLDAELIEEQKLARKQEE